MTFSKESAEEFTQSLAQLFSVGWRQIFWAQKEGIPKALGLTTQEWVQQRLGGYVKMSIIDRREAVAELARENLTTREIAGIVGVGKSTVDRDMTVPYGPNEQDSAIQNEDEAGPYGTDEEPVRIQQAPIAMTVSESKKREIQQEVREQNAPKRTMSLFISTFHSLEKFDIEDILSSSMIEDQERMWDRAIDRIREFCDEYCKIREQKGTLRIIK